MTERDFASNNGTIISASPFRAVIRRTDQTGADWEDNKSESNSNDSEREFNDEEDDQAFERDD